MVGVTYYFVKKSIKELVLECFNDQFLECLIDVVVGAIYACCFSVVCSVSFCDTSCWGILLGTQVWLRGCPGQ
jgi:hypothetical protein